MSNCLLSLVASLPGMVIIGGLIALLCVVLFDTKHGQRKTVRFREPGKIERGIHNVIANRNAPQEDIEFDRDDLLFKVEKEISPDSSVNTLRIFLEIISGTSKKRGDERFTTISKNRKSK